MPTVTFSRAVRKGAHVIVTAYGESGCGKTYSLIRLGRGLVGPNGKVGMIDTETGRGLIYASVRGGYEYAELTPPFTPERYVEAIDAAEDAGIDALILDSGSHEWEGLGGVLEIADNNNLKGLVKWAGPKARHKRYVQRLLNSRMHLLISLRAKEKMVQLTDKTPIPKGMKIGDIISAGYTPIQDKRFIFETTVQLFLPVYDDRRKLGVPIVEKCPEDLWGAFPEGEHISEETGRKIAEWVNGGDPVDHRYVQMKRAAEEAAGGGTEALREHWRTLDRTARDRLASQTENLASIGRAADQEQELRRQESGEQSRNAFAATDAPQSPPAGLAGSAPQPTAEPAEPHSAPRDGGAGTTSPADPASPVPEKGGRTTVAGAAEPAGEPGLVIAPAPGRNGKPDWRTWAGAQFLPKLRQRMTTPDLADFLGANEAHLDEARRTLDASDLRDLNAAITAQWDAVGEA